MEKAKELRITGAKLIFRNFSGKPDEYNRDGKRTVSIIVPNKELADDLAAQGWNVKRKEFPDSDKDPIYRIDVIANYKSDYPPRIYMKTKNNRELLDEDTVGNLDFVEIKNVDKLIISPHSWNINGRSGVKGYIKMMEVTIEEDTFEDAYNFGESESINEDDLPF